MLREVVARFGGRDVVLLDSISSVAEEDANQIVVSASHGGRSSGELALRVPLGAAFFNDAGVGKDDAGIHALGMLEERGVPAATYAHTSARIGDARDAWGHGIVSHVNDRAAAAGVRPGLSVGEAAEALGAA